MPPPHPKAATGRSAGLTSENVFEKAPVDGTVAFMRPLVREKRIRLEKMPTLFDVAVVTLRQPLLVLRQITTGVS